MDPYFIAVAARSAERIIGVLLGGLAIYYGYRLFLVVPIETHSDGKIKLPGMSVVLAKAGPGLFFAAFGALVVITSLMHAMSFDDGVIAYQGIATTSAIPESRRSAKPNPGSAPTAQDVSRVRLAIQTLNCLRRIHSVSPGAVPASDIDVALRDAKLALLTGVWNSGEWGALDTFVLWAAGGVDNTPSAAKALFDAEREICTR